MHKHGLCLTLFLFYGAVLCQNKHTTKKPLTILAYLQGIKPGQNLKFPAFLISPIIIVPKAVKESQAVTDDKSFEEDAILKNSIPVKIVLNATRRNDENNDIEVSFRQALNRGSGGKSDVSENKTNEAAEGIVMVNNNTIENIDQENKMNISDTTPATELALQNITELTTEASGLYPTAVYDDQVVNTITITDGPPNSFLLPPLLDEEWKNFTVTADINITKGNTTEDIESSYNTTTSQSVNETDSTIKGPYPAALYHNEEIDQVSITTNSYTNESPLPPPRDDRWTRFSSLGETFSTSSEFRPLAGLYYDGFLHRPLPNRNPGFAPYNHYVIY